MEHKPRRARHPYVTDTMRCRHLIQTWKAQGCMICGESDPVVIDAHHVDPAQKLFAISHLRAIMGYLRITPALVTNELTKCLPLCRNCHQKLHAHHIPDPFAEGS